MNMAGGEVITNMRPVFRWQRPPTRRAVWCVVAFAISAAAMVAGGGAFLWAVYRDWRAPGVISFGAALFVLGFSAAVGCVGVWVASTGFRRPRSGP